MHVGKVLFFKANARATSSDALMADRMSHTGDPQGVALDRFKGAFFRWRQTWHRLLSSTLCSGKGAVLLPNLLSYQGSIIALDLKTEAITFATPWHRRRALLRLV